MGCLLKKQSLCRERYKLTCVKPEGALKVGEGNDVRKDEQTGRGTFIAKSSSQPIARSTSGEAVSYGYESITGAQTRREAGNSFRTTRGSALYKLKLGRGRRCKRDL